jgi:sugar phosphate permease
MTAQQPLDPMSARRAGIARWIQAGKRLGYACFGAAIVLFAVGFVIRFTPALTTTIVVLMIVGCFVLPPAIVFGYGLRAAEREERESAAASPRGRSAPDQPGSRSSGTGSDE